MDSAEEYVPDRMVPYGYNWQQHLPPHCPHPVPTVAHIPFPTSHGPYSSQQIAPASSYAAPIPQPYPSTAGFAGQSPSPPVPTESLDHLKQALQKIQELPQMADPLSLMASLIAIAAAGVQVSRTLYNFAGVFGGASEEIVSVGKDISAVSGILRDLHDFFDDDAQDLISTRALFNTNRILEDCKDVFAQIQRMLDCCNAAGRVNFWQSLQWSFRRDKVKPMCAKLESFKLTLAILLSTMRLARCKQDIGDSKSPTSTKKERRYRENLETDILNNSAAIIRWQQVEIEFKSGPPSYPYSAHRAASTTPSKELEWLSNLVPYKPPQPCTHHGTSYFLPMPPIPETQDHFDKQVQLRIQKTVNALLDKWTTLRQNPQNSMHDSLRSNHRHRSKPRRQHVLETSDRGDAGSDKARSEKSQPCSIGLAAAIPDVPVDVAYPGNINDALDTKTDRLSSTEPSHISGIDVDNYNAVNQKWKESIHSRDINITINQISDHEVDDATENSDEITEGEEDSGWANGYRGPGHTEYERSDSSSSRSITLSEATSGPPRRPWARARRPPPPSSLSSEDYAFVHPSAIPQSHAPPYGAWPYRPHGPPPIALLSYGPAPHAPSPYTHMGYGLQPLLGSAQTIHEPSSGVPVPYMNLHPPGPVYGHYPGFNLFPIPQPTPVAQVYNGPPAIRRDDQVDTLDEKVENLKKELEEKDMANRAHMEKLLEDQLTKEAARRAKEDAELTARRDRAEVEMRAKEETAELTVRRTTEAESRAKEETELAAFEKREKDRIDHESFENKTVRFKDAVGRKFAFPYRQCKQWVDMETLIEQAFAHFENRKLADLVKRGHFDLADPSGALILPSLWETVIQPDWTVTMHMWPSPKAVEVPIQVPPPQSPSPSPKSVLPPAPMAPSVVFESRSRATHRERIAVEPRGRASHRETDSVTESMSTDEDSDHSNRKSTYQYVLTESFMRHGQQFEETWEAMMARSRMKAQKTILEMWLGESEAELRELEQSPSRAQSTRRLSQNATSPPADILEGGNSEWSVPGQEHQASKDLPRPEDARSSGQRQPPPPATSPVGDTELCQSCQSPLLLTKPGQQTPVVNQTGSFRSLGEEMEHSSPLHDPPRSSLERRLEMLEDLIKRQEAGRQASLDKAKSVENEQRLNHLEKAMAQKGVRTPPITPKMSEYSPMSPTEPISSRPAPSRLASGPASNGSRSSFRKRLFGRSASSSAAVA